MIVQGVQSDSCLDLNLNLLGGGCDGGTKAMNRTWVYFSVFVFVFKSKKNWSKPEPPQLLCQNQRKKGNCGAIWRFEDKVVTLCNQQFAVCWGDGWLWTWGETVPQERSCCEIGGTGKRQQASSRRFFASEWFEGQLDWELDRTDFCFFPS